jgi:hypothetical protein
MHDVSIDFTVGRKDHTLEIRRMAPTYFLPTFGGSERQCEFTLDGVEFSYRLVADPAEWTCSETEVILEPEDMWEGVHVHVQDQVLDALDAAFSEIDGRLDNALAEMLERWTQDGLDAWRTA